MNRRLDWSLDGLKTRLLFVSLGILVLDQWSKWMVEVHLPHHVAHPVLPGLVNLIYVQNTGVAFGLFATNGHIPGTVLLTALGLTALGIVIVYYWRASSSNRVLLFCLALVLGGAVGNLLDRIARGSVTDFIDVYLGSHHWPTFNLADSAISIGIALMAFDALRPRRAAAKEAS